MSALAWIDFDEAERQRAQRLMDLFREQESRDELGLGGIRDSIADHLFPGTSTIQTRLRYMLFVPWIFEALPPKGSATDLARHARGQEARLRDALLAGQEGVGVIGREAGASLKRLPSAVYWSGLRSWGIRAFEGSIDSYFASLPHWRTHAAHGHQGDDAQVAGKAARLWHASLPPAPADLMERAKFGLSKEEAGFLIDRLIEQQGASLLSFLASRGDKSRCDQIWTHPHLADFPPAPRALVGHAQVFAAVMHGAALLYNLLLSELRGRDEWIDYYESELADWRQALDLMALRYWSLDDFWDAVRHPGHHVIESSRRFVAEWLGQVRTSRALRADRGAAAALVMARERRLKTSQSRFTNQAARDRWRGASGAARFEFRWPQASSHLKDLADAL